MIHSLGGVVSLEQPNGQMGMCSWIGEATAVWAKFDADPHTLQFGALRLHLVDAMPRKYGEERPAPNYWAAVCFKRS